MIIIHGTGSYAVMAFGIFTYNLGIAAGGGGGGPTTPRTTDTGIYIGIGVC